MFTYIKLFVYNFLVLILGLPLAVLWGIIIAISAFIYTWIWGPALKTVLMWLYASVPLVLAFLRSVYRPFVDVSARIFRQIRLRSSVNGKATIHTKADWLYDSYVRVCLCVTFFNNLSACFVMCVVHVWRLSPCTCLFQPIPNKCWIINH